MYNNTGRSFRSFTGIIVVVASLLAVGCSNSSSPGFLQEGPYAGRPYDNASKGVQITRVYYDEEGNREAGGLHNEWIVIQSDRNIYTKGWWISTKNNVRSYAFPDTLKNMLLVYTNPKVGTPGEKERSMDLHRWILERHDTIRIYNSSSMIVTQYGY